MDLGLQLQRQLSQILAPAYCTALPHYTLTRYRLHRGYPTPHLTTLLTPKPASYHTRITRGVALRSNAKNGQAVGPWPTLPIMHVSTRGEALRSNAKNSKAVGLGPTPLAWASNTSPLRGPLSLSLTNRQARRLVIHISKTLSPSAAASHTHHECRFSFGVIQSRAVLRFLLPRQVTTKKSAASRPSCRQLLGIAF
jgi:hypothetical protein